MNLSRTIQPPLARALLVAGLTGVSIAAAGGPTSAQSLSQVGSGWRGSFAGDSQTGNDGHLGVVRDPTAGAARFLVSSRGIGAVQPHLLYTFDLDGVLDTMTPPIQQSGGATSSAWGYRDGATTTDGSGTGVVFWGHDAGIDVVDATTGTLVPTGTAIGPAGTPLATNPIVPAGGVTLGTYRAIAFDPTGDGGAGAIWSMDFGSDLVVTSLDGLRTTSFTNTGAAWGYGLAYDPVTTNLWVNDLLADEIVEIDRAVTLATGTLTATGNVLQRAAGSPGGLDGWTDANGRFNLVALTQGAVDVVEVFGVHSDAHVDAYRKEIVLRCGVDGGPLDVRSTIDWRSSTWDLVAQNVPDGPNGGSPWSVAMFFDIPPESTTTATLPLFPGLSEWVSVTSFSSPSGFFFDWNTVSEVRLPFPVTVINSLGLNIQPGGVIRVQAAYLDPRVTGNVGIPLWTTNEVYFDVDFTQPPPAITVSADGLNSFSSDPSTGFWQCENTSNRTIERLEISAVGSGLNGLVFDIDQTGMADVFEGGDGNGGCAGTYRLGSDVATGLIYDAMTTPPVLCTGANSGFLASDPLGGGAATGEFQTLAFRFTDFGIGETFHWDVDTDDPTNTLIRGDLLAGLNVTITLDGGTVLQGSLVQVGPQRAEIVFNNP